MQAATPSRTALRVALRRAAHQSVDAPVVFNDPLAVRIIGPYADQLRAPQRLTSSTLRAFLVARSRYAEDTLAAGIANGVRQYVLLGAGLDTFAYRNPHEGLRVFEVDHPATQGWKVELLRETGIEVPASVVHVPVDFEHQSLPSQLLDSGFDPESPAFFAWLGVVPYLTEPAFAATLGFIAERPAGSGFVMDYARPLEQLPLLERTAVESLAQRVASAGEPFQLFFDPATLHERLHVLGFSRLEDLGGKEINQRYFDDRQDGLRILGGAGRLLSAWR